jgi:hypothetical protein
MASRPPPEPRRSGAFAPCWELSARKADVSRLLGSKERAASDEPLLERLRRVRPALHLAGAFRLRDCAPWLREWEHVERRQFSTTTRAFAGRWWMEGQHFRPLAQHSLRLLDEQPLGRSAYHFGPSGGGRHDVPECLPERRAKLGELRPGATAQEVLALLGSPDHVRRPGAWSEGWEYDSRTPAGWVTTAVLFADGAVTQVEQTPPDWPRRERELLRTA